jgi:hypothetical protein
MFPRDTVTCYNCAHIKWNCASERNYQRMLWKVHDFKLLIDTLCPFLLVIDLFLTQELGSVTLTYINIYTHLHFDRSCRKTRKKFCVFSKRYPCSFPQ